MKCLIGLFTPEQGEILYDGRPLSRMDDKQRRQLRTELGMLFQGSALFDNETVLGNVMFPLKMLSHNMTRHEQIERAKFCIERVGLQGANDKYPSEISGGMQKRVAIARAIALNPRYLFCDEPNSGLDPQTSILIGEHIIFIDKGRCDWTGDDRSIFRSKSKALNDFVFASHLFKEVKLYLERDADANPAKSQKIDSLENEIKP